MSSESETDVVQVNRNFSRVEISGDAEKPNRPKFSTRTRATCQASTEPQKIHVEFNLNVMKISLDYDTEGFAVASKFIEFMKESIDLANSENSEMILDGLTKQIRQKKEDDNISGIIHNLVNSKSSEDGINKLYEKFLCVDESQQFQVQKQFVEKLIEFLMSLSDEKIQDSLNFMKLITNSEKFSDSVILSIFFEIFNDQLSAKIKMLAKGLENSEVVRLCLIRAIGVELGAFDFRKVVVEILNGFLEVELGFDVFCAGLQQLAKLIMVGMDEDFEKFQLHKAIVKALEKPELSTFSGEGQYPSFLQLADSIKSQLENQD